MIAKFRGGPKCGETMEVDDTNPPANIYVQTVAPQAHADPLATEAEMPVDEYRRQYVYDLPWEDNPTGVEYWWVRLRRQYDNRGRIVRRGRVVRG